MTIQTKIAAETKTNLAPRMAPDAAFRAGLLEATHRAEERHKSLLMRCEAVEAERDALLAKIAKLEASSGASCILIAGDDTGLAGL